MHVIMDGDGTNGYKRHVILFKLFGGVGIQRCLQDWRTMLVYYVTRQTVHRRPMIFALAVGAHG